MRASYWVVVSLVRKVSAKKEVLGLEMARMAVNGTSLHDMRRGNDVA